MADESQQSTSKTTAPAGGLLGTVERLGNQYLVKSAPFQIPANGREMIVKFLPWLTLISGVIMLSLAWSAYSFYSYINPSLYVLSQYTGYNVAIGPFDWIAIASLVVTALVYFAAFPDLRTRKKRGWNLLVYAQLLFLAYGIVWLFGHGGLNNLISSVVSTLIGLYLLFQIRDYYKA